MDEESIESVEACELGLDSSPLPLRSTLEFKSARGGSCFNLLCLISKQFRFVMNEPQTVYLDHSWDSLTI